MLRREETIFHCIRNIQIAVFPTLLIITFRKVNILKDGDLSKKMKSPACHTVEE